MLTKNIIVISNDVDFKREASILCVKALDAEPATHEVSVDFAAGLNVSLNYLAIVNIAPGYVYTEELFKKLIDLRNVKTICCGNNSSRMDRLETMLDAIRTKSYALPNKKHYVLAIASSTGGLTATKEYLSSLDESINAVIYVVQHQKDEEGVSIIVSIFRSICKFNVIEASTGVAPKKGDTIVVPYGKKINFKDGVMILADDNNADFSPNIDNCFVKLKEKYGSDVSCVILSGMGGDGSTGASNIAKAGGALYTQSRQTCTISTMPENIRKAYSSDLTGSPRSLARAASLQYRLMSGGYS